MADTHTYNYDDIQRYLQQQMTPEEMHAFEKAMMEDPFLADALEGFQNSDAYITNRHLFEIEQQVAGAQKGKVVPMIPATRRWWRVAALFIVIAGIGFVTYFLMDRTSTSNEMAGNTGVTAKTPETPAADTLRPADESFTEPGVFKEEAPKSEQTLPPVTRETSAKDANEGLIASSKRMKQPENESPQLAMEDKSRAAPEKPIALSAPVMAAESVKPQNQSLLKQNLQQRFEGQVTDMEGRPLASASVIVNNNHVAVTDANGNFSINAPDSTVEVKVALVGFAPATAKISKETTGKIMLKESNLALNDVVVTGSATQRNKNQVGYSSTKMKREDNAGVAEPISGWQPFNDYIKAALKTLKDTGINYTSGDVHLEFTIDRKGNPTEVKVINPNTIDAAMQAKAIELLQKGPRWKPGKNSKAAVVIHF